MPKSPKAPTPDDFLPFPPLHLRILVALADGPAHGYRIVKTVDEKVGGHVHPANLYRRIRDLVDQGLVEETEPTEPSDDKRERKFFRITSLGRAVVAAEVGRMQTLLSEARAAVADA